MYPMTSLLKIPYDPEESLLKFKTNCKKRFYKNENIKAFGNFLCKKEWRNFKLVINSLH